MKVLSLIVFLSICNLMAFASAQSTIVPETVGIGLENPERAKHIQDAGGTKEINPGGHLVLLLRKFRRFIRILSSKEWQMKKVDL